MAQQETHLKTASSPLLLFIASVVGLLVLFFVYAIILQDSITAEVQTYLSEIANQSKHNIRTQMQSRMVTMRVIGSMVDAETLKDPQRFMSNLLQQRTISEFKRFGVILRGGEQFTTDNTRAQMMDRLFVHRAFSGESGISDIMPDPVDGEPVHIYFLPVATGDEVQAVLFAVSSNETFVGMLQTEFFNNTGFSHLVHKNGDIIRSSNIMSLSGHNNLFDLLENMPKKALISTTDLMDSMRRDESGRFSYYNNEKHRYVYYTPLNINNWYLIFSIPAGEVDRLTMQRLLWTFALVALIILFLAMVSWRLFIREKGYKRTILSQMEELRTITANIPGGVQRCRHDEWLTMDYVSDGFVEMVGYPREVLQQRFSNKFLPMIHSDDLFPALRRIDAQLAKGNSIDLEFRINRSDNTSFWAHLKGILVREGQEELLYCVLLDETELRNATEVLQMDSARYAVLLKLSDSILFEFDMRTAQISTSPRYEETFGYALPESNFPQSVLDLGLVHPDDIESFTNLFESLYDGHTESEAEIRVCQSSGEYMWCRFQVMGILDQNHICSKAIGKITDINATMQELVKLKEEVQRDPFTQLYNKVATESLIREAMDAKTPGALFLIDVDNFKSVNDELGHAFGDTVLLTLASRLQNLFRRDDIVGRIGGDEFAVFLCDIKDEDNLFERADAICRIFSMPVGAEEHGHHVSGSVGVATYPADAQDYETLYSMADKALYESKFRGKNCFTMASRTMGQPISVLPAVDPHQTDMLTGVADEATYTAEGARMVSEARFASTIIAVLAIKVGGLHHVNSVHGYAQGDAVLRSVADGLRVCLPTEALLARCRGNDFAAAVPLPTGDNEKWFQQFSTELATHMEAKMSDSALAWIRITTGISLYPNMGTDFEQLNRLARQAVALCPDTNLVSYEYYDEDHTRSMHEREELKRDLMLALHRNELELYFQPKVDPETKRVLSAEALIRWNHPDRGQLAPGQFIPLAEETMIIPLIDNWVIKAACRQWRELSDQGFPMVPISINLSHQKFYQPNLLQVIGEALATYDVPPSMLTVELTESCALADIVKAADIMSDLRKQGLQTAIDDFGSGFFTLNHLRDLPLDEVKLDRSLVTDSSNTATESLRSLVNLVKVYKARVVFEGVETDEQYARAGETGCDLIQGFFTGRPMTSEDLGRLIVSQLEADAPESQNQPPEEQTLEEQTAEEQTPDSPRRTDEGPPPTVHA